MEIQVSLPGLHISLGVFDRLWTLLEDACTELDLLLAEHISVGCIFDVTATLLEEPFVVLLQGLEGSLWTPIPCDYISGS